MSDPIRQFTAQGNETFRTYLLQLRETPTLSPPWQLLTDPAMSESAPFITSIERKPRGVLFGDRYEFGIYLAKTLESVDRAKISLNPSLWNWLALYFFDQLCPPDAAGRRSPREEAVYYLPAKYKHNRYYRHLVRSPWLAVTMHKEKSRVILIPISSRGAPLALTGEIFEQVAGRQGVFRSANILAAIYNMYFDSDKGRPRSGTGGRGGGSPNRLGMILKQFELTYDLEWGNEDVVLGLLPKEFTPWKQFAQAVAD